MAAISDLPGAREVLADLRGADRGLRVSTHVDQGLVVLSVWRQDRCVASAQLGPDEVSALIAVLASGLAELEPAGSASVDLSPLIAS